MRPISLHLQNFGPFLNEKIDFTAIQANQLFLISGKTGSGKTMIFDSIVYALYGRASTEKREVKQLRSHFAEASEPLTVEFEFEIKNHRYKVIRKASYLKPGNKNETKPELEIYQFDGEQFVLEESKINAGEKYLLELLGLKQHQFRQLFILPQGEFKTFLFSNSTEKQTILRTLFNTQLYDTLKNKLVAQTESVKKEIDIQNTKVDSLWQELYTFDNELLNDAKQLPAIQYKNVLTHLPKFEEIGNEQVSLLNQRKIDLEKTVDHLQNEILMQEKRETSAQKYNQLKDSVTELESQKEDIDFYEKQLHLFNKSKLALRLHADVRKEYANQKEKEEMIDAIEENLKVDKQNLHETQQQYDSLMTQQEEVQQLQSYNQQTLYYYQNISMLKEKYTSIKDLSEALENLTQDINENKSKLKELKEEKGQDEPDYQTVNVLQQDLFEMQSSLNEAKDHQKFYEQRCDNEARLEALNNEYNGISEQLKEVEEAFHQFSHNETVMISNEEAIVQLRQHLKENESCPVCGEVVTHLPKDQHFEELKALNDENERLLTQKTDLKERLVEKSSLIQLLTKQIEEVNDYVNQNDCIESLEQAIKQKKDKIKTIQASLKQIEALNEKISTLEKEISEAKQTKIIKEEKLNHHKELITAFNESTGFETIKEFKNQFESNEHQIENFEKKVQNLKQEHQKHQEAMTKHEIQLQHNKEQSQALQQKITSLEKELESELAKLDIDNVEELLEINKNVDQEEKFKNTIEDYYQKLQMTKASLKNEEAVLNSIEAQDLEALINEKNKYKTTFDEAVKQFNQVDFQVNENKKTLKKIKDLINHLENTINNHLEMVNLANVLSGKNSQNLTLENYVLIYYLERILIEANKHLLMMTGQRYELHRKVSKGRGFSGLEIEVFDYYSNQSRHIASLSGGETFQASLALALGLCEIVQREQGGISLDAMFIDEGFGTLDQETLETAIETLIQLQSSGRLVGIISHVSELKERIPVVLEVHSTNYQSYTRLNNDGEII